MKDENGNFAKAISAAQKAGEQVVVVHGGGPQIDAALNAKGIVSTWIGGFRVTTQEIFDVVEDVLVNQVGPEVAATLGRAGIKAQALSARTLPTVIASRRKGLIDGTPADLGFVGEVESVNPAYLLELLAQGVVPVVAPVSSDVDLKTGLNVNADFMSLVNKIIEIINTNCPAFPPSVKRENKNVIIKTKRIFLLNRDNFSLNKV